MKHKTEEAKKSCKIRWGEDTGIESMCEYTANILPNFILVGTIEMNLS